MEKHVPHYSLGDAKNILLKRGMDAFTSTAKNNARQMGLDGQAAIDVVLGFAAQYVVQKHDHTY